MCCFVCRVCLPRLPQSERATSRLFPSPPHFLTTLCNPSCPNILPQRTVYPRFPNLPAPLTGSVHTAPSYAPTAPYNLCTIHPRDAAVGAYQTSRHGERDPNADTTKWVDTDFGNMSLTDQVGAHYSEQHIAAQDQAAQAASYSSARGLPIRGKNLPPKASFSTSTSGNRGGCLCGSPGPGGTHRCFVHPVTRDSGRHRGASLLAGRAPGAGPSTSPPRRQRPERVTPHLHNTVRRYAGDSI